MWHGAISNKYGGRRRAWCGTAAAAAVEERVRLQRPRTM